MKPLASIIRPISIDDFIGQDHLVGPGKPLRLAINQGHLFSFILWGPPGSGKTTLARIYTTSLNAKLYEFSAVSSGKKDIQAIISDQIDNKSKVLFLDEIHRFNKAQQDFLLPYVESGEITLIGATTENPSFEVISALLSRCRIFVFNTLSEKEMSQIIDRTGFKLNTEVKEWLINMANGDARQVITMIDSANKLYGEISLNSLEETIQNKSIRYDKKGDEHYNTISAFIKSMRASQVDAALYYLSRMIRAGEDPKFIARRMIIFASEDIGMAQPTALVVANEVFRSVEVIGLPECGINLAHGVVYLCKSKKDRSSYNAYLRALSDVDKYGNLNIPLKVCNPATKMMKDMDYGKDYEEYSKESFLPDKIKNKKYYLGEK
ncbi:MAG: replication-associated recombination protein A [Candidatus Nealsonbacteria bacterium]|nr:replication-associated recombination protein A [Candidatus Nealsonbacteria bacterium]